MSRAAATTRRRAARRHTFAEVRIALREQWGLALHRGGDLTDLGRDGRWSLEYSKTGFLVAGDIPGIGYGHLRYTSLARVVQAFGLAEANGAARRPR